MKTTEIDLIDQAADQLKQNTGFKVEINQFSKQDLDAAGFIDTGATRIPIEIYIKKVISTGIIPAIAHKFTGITVQSLVVAQHINPMLAERLKEMDISGCIVICVIANIIKLRLSNPCQL